MEEKKEAHKQKWMSLLEQKGQELLSTKKNELQEIKKEIPSEISTRLKRSRWTMMMKKKMMKMMVLGHRNSLNPMIQLQKQRQWRKKSCKVPNKCFPDSFKSRNITQIFSSGHTSLE